MAATHESLAMLAAVRALDLDGVASDVEIEETRAALRDAREMLANPLAYPPREEKDRAVARQGAVEVRGREVRLGALDIENALVLRCVGVARRIDHGSDGARTSPPNASPRSGGDPDARPHHRFLPVSRGGALSARARDALGASPGEGHPRASRRPIQNDERRARSSVAPVLSLLSRSVLPARLTRASLTTFSPSPRLDANNE